jgi:hypothetical protein
LVPDVTEVKHEKNLHSENTADDFAVVEEKLTAPPFSLSESNSENVQKWNFAQTPLPGAGRASPLTQFAEV